MVKIRAFFVLVALLMGLQGVALADDNDNKSIKDTVKETKDTVKDAKDTVKDTKDTVKDVKDTINSFKGLFD
jgi:septal ring factor EnvC (AmiA/AmiB activator)